jgi:hypothetical protein
LQNDCENTFGEMKGWTCRAAWQKASGDILAFLIRFAPNFTQ